MNWKEMERVGWVWAPRTGGLPACQHSPACRNFVSAPTPAHTPALALYSRQSDCRGRIFRFCAEKKALILSFQLIINYLAPNDCRRVWRKRALARRRRGTPRRRLCFRPIWLRAILKSPASQIKLNCGSHVWLCFSSASLAACVEWLYFPTADDLFYISLSWPKSHFTACDRRRWWRKILVYSKSFCF